MRFIVRIGLMYVLVCVLTADPGEAADRFVAVSGSDAANDCLVSASPCATIGTALGQAASADTIKVAGGVYRESLLIDASTALTVEGGWSADFGTRDPALNPTTLDVRSLGRVVDVAAGAGETITLTLDGLTITHGKAIGGGSGIRATTFGDGTIALTLRHCRVDANRTVGDDFPGGIRTTALPPGTLQLDVSDSVIRRNAGGILLEGAVSATFADSTLERNRGLAALQVRAHDASVTVTGCTIDRNSPAVAAVWFLGDAGTSSLSVARTTVTRNRSVPGVRGVLLQAVFGAVNAQLTNCVLRDNRSRLGGGSGLTATADGAPLDLTVASSTVVHNRGGGIRLAGYAAPVTMALTNTILRANALPDFPDLKLDVLSGSVTASADHDVLGVISGSGTFVDLGGNLSVDPLLVGRTDVHLTAASPAIDAGTCTGAPATDFEGDPRPSGGGCDIGADEFVP